MLPFEIDISSLTIENEKKDILKHNHSRSLNMRAAFLHIIGDALQSVGVIIAGIVIYFYPQYSEADPICTLLFSIIVMFTTVPIVKDCVKVLMEGTPNDINVNEIKNKLLKVRATQIEGVLEVHEFHIWSLSASKACMSCHLVSTDPHLPLEKAIALLKNDYGITNTTVQIELQGEKHSLTCDPSFY
jgi:zinc transporter 2